MLRKEWIRKSPAEQWRWTLSHVSPLLDAEGRLFKIPFFKNTDEESLYLVPELLKTAPDWVRSRARREGTLVFSQSPRNSLGCIYFCDHEAFSNSYFMRLLRTYYDTGVELGVMEPIIMGSKDFLVDGIDSLCGARVHTCFMGHWVSINKMIPDDVNEEVGTFVFMNPYENTVKLKKATSVIKQNFFSLTGAPIVTGKPNVP